MLLSSLKLIKCCWSYEQKDRPSFEYISGMLTSIKNFQEQPNLDNISEQDASNASSFKVHKIETSFTTVG